jgi:PhoD related phosphatase
MQNLWDDHDIIDGFGSYPSPFMQCPVFSNLGMAAFKYYLLFQHQTSIEEGMSIESWDKSIIFGPEKGPYIKHHSRSVVNWLGKDVLFLGKYFEYCVNLQVWTIGPNEPDIESIMMILIKRYSIV